MKKPNRMLRIILIAVAVLALAPQRAQAEDAITPGSAQSTEISKIPLQKDHDQLRGHPDQGD